MSRKLSKMNIAALILAVSFAAQQSFDNIAAATNISGITGNNGVYNIDPAKVNGDIGLREYTNFTLSRGDIANLIFKYGAQNVSKFVNLVDNQININGIVNSIRDGQFYNGEAVFVSPNGMVVGESGVINVGALSILTPTESGMKLYKQGKATLEELGYNGYGNITVNGKILSRGNVGIVGQDVNIGANADIIAGGGANLTKVSTEAEATALFNSLVNTGKNSNRAYVEVRSHDRKGNGAVGMNIEGNITNFGVGDLKIINRGPNFNTSTASTIAAHGGDVYLTNGKGTMNVNGSVIADNGTVRIASGTQSGAVNIGSQANLTAKDLVEIVHNGAGNTTIGGQINSKNNIYITEKKGDLNINGTINGKNGRIVIAANGTGLTFGDKSVINHDNQLRIANTGRNGLTFNGTINNSGSTAMTSRAGNMVVNGSITNTAGKMNLTNTSGKMTLTDASRIKGANEIIIQNTGADGMELNGMIENSANTYLQNTKGDMTVAGTVHNTGNKTLSIYNKGGSLTIADGASVYGQNKNLSVNNKGTGGLTIDGAVENNGSTYIYNKNGDLNINKTVTNQGGTLYVANYGKTLNIANTATVKNSGNNAKLNILNRGNGGLELDGTVQNAGTTYITSMNGDMNVNGTVTNSAGVLRLQNGGNAMNITETANVTNSTDAVYMTNNGVGGMNIDGNVSGAGHVVALNKKGGMNVTGTVQSTRGNVHLKNVGTDDMAVEGLVKGKKVTLTNVGSDVVLGNVATGEAVVQATEKVIVDVTNGNVLNAGTEGDLIKSDGDLFMVANNGTIGEDVVTDDAIGKDARDLTKSINVNVKGKIKAYTNDKAKTGDDLVINLASKGVDMNVDHVRADGKVMLLTDKDATGKAGSILNASTNLKKYANVKGSTVQLISGGSVGTADKALHFRQEDATQQSNVVAVKDVNLHHRGNAEGEDFNFGTIKSKTGSIKANMIKNGTVENAVAPKDINIRSRKNGANLVIENETSDVNLIKDYFD